MKKKLYLRIRALILVILLILSSLIIAPEQVLADTEVVAGEETQIAADEEMPQVTAGEETTQVTADEETTETISNSEDQNDSGQPGNETDTETEIDTDTDEPQDKTSESAIETDPDSTELPSEPELDPIDETDALSDPDAMNEETDVASETTSLPIPESTFQPTEINSEGSDDTDTDTLPTVESPEAEQTVEEAVSDKQEKEDADTSMSDPAEQGIGTRAAYTPEKYFIFNSTTKTITEYTGSNKVVHIPPYINGVKVEHIGDSAFRNKGLTSVTIPKGVITVGHNTFKSNELTDVAIANSVLEIGDDAFTFNELTSITIPDSVTTIGKCAFECNKLKDVTIPDSVLKIGYKAFAGNQLTSVTIANSVLFIEDYAFSDNQLKNVTLPSNLLSIGEWAFEKNPISWASIPAGIAWIEMAESHGQIVSPTIEQVGQYCFDPGVFLIAKRYIKANYYIREAPNGKVITKLWRPLYVTGTSIGTQAWLKFTYNGKPAFVALAATSTNSPPMTGYAKQTLNIRSTPGGSIIGTIPIGRKVNGNLDKNMVKTTYNGKTGYVYASLLQKDPVQVTRYVKAGSNIRSAPGGTIIETLKMPIFVTGTITGNYLRFTYKSKTAYVAMSLTTTQNPPITGYAKSAVNVRNAPGGSIIGTLPVGRQVKGVLAGNMVRFTYNSQTGYVYVSMLQATPVRVTRYVVANSIIRSAPGGSIIARPWRPLLVSGTIQGAWLKFTYNGRTAYVAMSSTTTQNPPITGYTKSTVNVRSSPGGSVIGSLPANRKVSGVLVGNWVKFTYAGRTGYISASLLKK